MRWIDGTLGHKGLTKSMRQKLAFDESKDYDSWKSQIKEKLIELLGMENIKANACPLRMQIEEETQKEGYKQIRFSFESEKEEFVPCYLLIPDADKKKYPLAIMMQGHSTGVHNTIGVVKFPEDEGYANGRGGIGVQAVKNGYAVLAIEQRGMGERKPDYASQGASMCEYTAHIALHLGRTILGERIWDISKAIDLMENFERIDREKIFIAGGSGGGTISYYAACLEDRIKLSVPVCAFCPYEKSILNSYHCSCNFIPRAYEWFEMQDLACLIAPKELLIINGQKDRIFPIDSAKEGFERIKRIYERDGAGDKCQLLETPEGHFWCVDLIWDAINRTTKKLGW